MASEHRRGKNPCQSKRRVMIKFDDLKVLQYSNNRLMMTRTTCSNLPHRLQQPAT